MFGFGVYGVFNIKLDYDSIWFMDQKSYQTQYYKSLQDTFPEYGERVEVYVGQIPYWNMSQEMFQIENVLNSSQYIKSDSIQFWYPQFYNDCCIPNPEKYCKIPGSEFFGDADCAEELGFKQKLLLFLKENQFYFHDLRFNISFETIDEDSAMDHFFNGDFELTASRAKFQHSELKNTTIKSKAMTEIKNGLNQIHFNLSDLPSPVAYSIMYVQWEANDIISGTLLPERSEGGNKAHSGFNFIPLYHPRFARVRLVEKNKRYNQ